MRGKFFYRRQTDGHWTDNIIVAVLYYAEHHITKIGPLCSSCNKKLWWCTMHFAAIHLMISH